MNAYAATHDRALALARRKGAPVTFQRASAGTYDPLTDQTTGATTVMVSGYAVRGKGDPLKYQALELIQSEAPTLSFVPTIYGQRPALGASVVFGGETFVVRDVDPIAPDGITIAARVIVASGGA